MKEFDEVLEALDFVSSTMDIVCSLTAADDLLTFSVFMSDSRMTELDAIVLVDGYLTEVLNMAMKSMDDPAKFFKKIDDLVDLMAPSSWSDSDELQILMSFDKENADTTLKSGSTFADITNLEIIALIYLRANRFVQTARGNGFLTPERMKDMQERLIPVIRHTPEGNKP